MYFAPCLAACAAGATLTLVRTRRNRRREAVARKSRLLIRTVMSGACKAGEILNDSADSFSPEHSTPQCPQMGVAVNDEWGADWSSFDCDVASFDQPAYITTAAAVTHESSDAAA